MSIYRICMACGCALLLTALAEHSRAAAPLPSNAASATAAAREIEALADKVDQHLLLRLAEAKVQPAPRADDSEFIRRVYLDLVGRIPTVAEIRKFERDRSPDKRRKLIDQLLASPGYVKHFTNEWRALFMAEADSSFVGRYLVPGFENWLQKELSDNASYD